LSSKLVLITGGLGFIGSNLAPELGGRGFDVWVVDNRSSTNPQAIRCDVGNYRQIERVLQDHDFDYVYHAAAEYGRWNGEDYYEDLWNSNVVGTKNMLRLQEKNKFRLIFFGSAEVYADYDGITTEDIMEKVPLRQMNDYAMTKWVNEMQIMNSATMTGTETVRVRLFNVYGPGEHYTPYRGVIPSFIYKAMHDLPYTVYRGHRRTFEYVLDICESLGNIIQNFKPGEVYNLGSEKQYEIKDVSDMILKKIGKEDDKVTYMDSEPFTTRIKTPDSSKARKDLQHNPKTTLETGIMKTVEWMGSTERTPTLKM